MALKKRWLLPENGNLYKANLHCHSTGPKIYNMWLEDGILYIECSPVCGVYVHGKKYSHRYTMIKDNDTITKAEFDIGEKFADSDYFFVKIVDTKGARAWTCPYSPKEI